MSKEQIHIMLDLETMSAEPNAAITAIGACTMDPESVVNGSVFYSQVDLESSARHGHMDPRTVKWWMQQSDDARSHLQVDNTLGGHDQRIVLVRFHEWLDFVTEDDKYEAVLWGNGATFDNVVLANAYKAVGLTRPWSYRNDRCYRTLKNLYSHVPLPERMGTEHNALDDALYQAAHVARIVQAGGRFA